MHFIFSVVVITTSIFCSVTAIPDPSDFQPSDFDENFDLPQEKFEKFNNKDRIEDDAYVGGPPEERANFVPQRGDDAPGSRRWEDTDNRAKAKENVRRGWEETDDRRSTGLTGRENAGLDRDDDRDSDERYRTTSESQDNVNQFIDHILHSVGSLGMVGPTRIHLPLPNVRKHFAKKWFGINFTGEATLFNCYIDNGLSTIHRVGDGHLSTQKNGDRLTRKIRFEFRIKYLQVASNFTIKFLKHGPSGQFHATSDEIIVGAEITINSRPQKGDINANMDIDVSYWDFITFKGLKFKLIEFWSTTKKVIKFMRPFVSKMFKRRLTDNTKAKIESLVTQVVREAKSPRNNRALTALTLKFL